MLLLSQINSNAQQPEASTQQCTLDCDSLIYQISYDKFSDSNLVEINITNSKHDTIWLMITVEQTMVVSDTFWLWVAPNERYLDEYNQLISLSPGQSLDYVSMKVPANNVVNVLLFYVADLNEFLSTCSDINTPPSRVNYGSFDVVSYMYENNLSYATGLNISINKIKNNFDCSQVTLELEKY